MTPPKESSRPLILTRLAVLAIRGYQRLLSPLFPGTCRYAPSCSEYAVRAFERHGLVRGTRYAVARISRCHPWSDGGYDPVPR
ncbi:MAG: membrane protein insertion efficiency factor YidD [Candidatus Eisenbacteria bacterium]|nr:membrane protein insertion efficiency factor YidD [Candidatus Eisenbacteria bacterium]